MADARALWRVGQFGPDTPPPPPPPPPPTPRSITGEYYEVVAGDTLTAIGADWGYTVEELATFNEINDPNIIKVGRWLVAPDVQSPTTANTRGQVIAWLDVNGVDLNKKAKSKYTKEELLEFVASYVDAD